MTYVQVLRIQKLKRKTTIEVAARHNLREILAEMGAVKGGHIDAVRSKFNRILIGCNTANGVASAAKELLIEAGIKRMRKNGVRALEILFSLPPQSSIDQDCFFKEAIEWVEQYFKAPIISAVIHNDEAAPHCHVLLLPLVAGRMIGSDLMGGPARLKALQSDFHVQVGQRHGLSHQPEQKRHSATIKRQAMDLAFGALEANSGLNSDVLRVLLEPHKNNPEPLMAVLGIKMPKPTTSGTFVGIMTKPCKPEKTIGFTPSTPIGFDAAVISKQEQTLSCVGFASSAAPFSPPFELQSSATSEAIDEFASVAANSTPSHGEIGGKAIASHSANALSLAMESPLTASGDDYTRQRDAEHPAGYWDESLGEFVDPPIKVSNRCRVAELVRIALIKRSPII